RRARRRVPRAPAPSAASRRGPGRPGRASAWRRRASAPVKLADSGAWPRRGQAPNSGARPRAVGPGPAVRDRSEEVEVAEGEVPGVAPLGERRRVVADPLADEAAP